MAEDEYESLPDSSGIATHMSAGAIAGILEHSIMYPVDCVKTRMQCLPPCPKSSYNNVFNALVNIIRQEGMGRTFRGIQAVIGGAGPAHAMYFACYENLKKKFHRGSGHHVLANGAAGVGATLLHDAVMTPAEVIKQRLQMYDSPYHGVRDCVTKSLKNEGIRAFYRSYTTQLTMNIPFQCSHFILYELMQDTLNNKRQYNPITHMISGGIAGAGAAALTTPLDVCKTLLNTQCVKMTSGNRPEGMLQAVQTVYSLYGVRGYFRGLQARVIFQIPGTAISWSVYEFFKYSLTSHGSKEDGLVYDDETGSQPRSDISGHLRSQAVSVPNIASVHPVASVTTPVAMYHNQRSS